MRLTLSYLWCPMWNNITLHSDRQERGFLLNQSEKGWRQNRLKNRKDKHDWQILEVHFSKPKEVRSSNQANWGTCDHHLMIKLSQGHMNRVMQRRVCLNKVFFTGSNTFAYTTEALSYLTGYDAMAIKTRLSASYICNLKKRQLIEITSLMNSIYFCQVIQLRCCTFW